MDVCVCVCVGVSQIFIDFGTVWPCIGILHAGRKYLYSQFLRLCGKFIFLHYSIIPIEMACVLKSRQVIGKYSTYDSGGIPVMSLNFAQLSSVINSNSLIIIEPLAIRMF